MSNSLRSLSFALAAMIPLAFSAGCTLYFGDDGGDGRGWDDAPPMDGGGYFCTTDRDCASGCYCDETKGTCTEAGFCQDNSDCGDGYVCDVTRSSCVPGDQCTTSTDCAAGSICTSGTCQASCVCANDAEAIAAGFDHCDEPRGTCETADPTGSCRGTITGNGNAPSCPEGQVATILDGAYTGNCEAITSCDLEPTCGAFQHESDCLNTADDNTCAAAYSGINCHTPNGTSCTAGGAMCTCDSYQFARCTDMSGNKQILETTGMPLPAGVLFQ